jgi:hypothetical protein
MLLPSCFSLIAAEVFIGVESVSRGSSVSVNVLNILFSLYPSVW